MNKHLGLFIIVLSLPVLTACAVGPDYERPPVETPTTFKEAANWSKADPEDDIDRGNWWDLYKDPILDGLELQIDISNQNLKAAEAAWEQAKALADETRSTLFPVLSLNASDTRSGSLASHPKPLTTYDWNAAATWELDVWGRIRRTLESQEATAEANAADLASARLSAQANLATDYFDLRVQDELERLLNDTVLDDQKILIIVRHQYDAGTAAKSDVLSAESQLHSVMALAINTQVKRQQLEHAIAVLIGKPPSEFTLEPKKFTFDVPTIPISVPSQLLERRPDIAASERAMAAANAEIGVATAAWYPTISLSALIGPSTNSLSQIFQASSMLWSLGASASETVFDAGGRIAAVEAAEAGYRQTVANYRQTVLTAFQQVEDELVAIKYLSDQLGVEELAVEEARQAENITLNQYQQGTVPYNTVLTAQITTLNDEQTALAIVSSRQDASVALIGALGGGWNVRDLSQPPGDVTSNNSPPKDQ